jgi:hypothetical protein
VGDLIFHPGMKFSFDEFIHNMMEDYKAGKILDLAVIYRTPPTDPEHYVANIKPFWFSTESCLGALGMVRIMMRMIEDYIKEDN